MDDANVHQQPTQSDKEEWNRIRKAEQRRDIAQKDDITGGVSARKSMTEEAILKRRQREERRAAALAKISGSQCETEDDSPSMPLDTTRPSTPAFTIGSSTAYTVKIPTSSTPLKWYQPSQHSFSTITAAKEARVWSYPSSPEERARCGVYRSLWEKGYYMGCGIKFGGEFLVYPG